MRISIIILSVKISHLMKGDTMINKLTAPKTLLASLAALFLGVVPAFAGEADLVVPSIKTISPHSYNLLLIGMVISVIGLIYIWFYRIFTY